MFKQQQQQQKCKGVNKQNIFSKQGIVSVSISLIHCDTSWIYFMCFNNLISLISNQIKRSMYPSWTLSKNKSVSIFCQSSKSYSCQLIQFLVNKNCPIYCKNNPSLIHVLLYTFSSDSTSKGKYWSHEKMMHIINKNL